MAGKKKAAPSDSPAEMSSDEKAELIRKVAERNVRRQLANGVPAFVNFGLAEPNKAPVDEFGLTEEGLADLASSANESDSDNE